MFASRYSYGSHVILTAQAPHLIYKCPGAIAGHTEVGVWWDGNGLATQEVRSLDNVGVSGGLYDTTVSGGVMQGYLSSQDEIGAAAVNTTSWSVSGTTFTINFQTQPVPFTTGAAITLVTPSLNGGSGNGVAVAMTVATSTTSSLTATAATSYPAQSFTEQGLIDIGAGTTYEYGMHYTEVMADASNTGLIKGDQIGVSISNQSVASGAWSVAGGTVTIATAT